MGKLKQQFGRYYPLLVVFVAVTLNVISALILKTLADAAHAAVLFLSGGIVLAILINGMRFMVWGYALKRFPLSSTYPLASVFFPIMLLVSYLYGETVTVNQIGGTVLILCGVFIMSAKTG